MESSNYAGSDGFRLNDGWSTKVNDPEFLAKLAEQKKAGKKWGTIIVFLPLAVMILLSLVGLVDIIVGLFIGAVLTGVFFGIRVLIRHNNSQKLDYEGVVTNKEIVKEEEPDPEEDETIFRDYGITTITTTTGETKRYKELLGTLAGGSRRAYTLLEVGDHVRYHADFTGCPYEIFEKSRLETLYCACCGKENALTADKCVKCSAPLLK